MLVDLALHNLEQADLTLKAARAAGVPIAAGHDWSPISDVALEIVHMVHHGLSAPEALVAATQTAARALGLGGHIGTIEPGGWPICSSPTAIRSRGPDCCATATESGWSSSSAPRSPAPRWSVSPPVSRRCRRPRSA